MTSDNFEIGMVFVFDAEKGKAVDTGGFTNMGISKDSYPDLDIANLTKGQVLKIYWNDFWVPCGCESFEKQLSVYLLDTSINCGVDRTCRWLQQAAGLEGEDVDGYVGPCTIRTILQKDQEQIADTLLSYRLEYYAALAKSPKYQPYFRGWVLRVSRLMQYV